MAVGGVIVGVTEGDWEEEKLLSDTRGVRLGRGEKVSSWALKSRSASDFNLGSGEAVFLAAFTESME